MARVIDILSQYFDGNGKPLAGGKLAFFQSGSSSVKLNTFKDVGMTILNENPLPLDGEGRVGNVYGEGSYRVVLSDQFGQQIDVFDNVSTSGVSVTSPVGAVNSIAITESISGASPRLSSTGQDSSVGMIIETKGTGGLRLQTDGGTVIDSDSNTEIRSGSETKVLSGGTERLNISSSGIALESGGARANKILNENDLASNSSTALATQSSIKKYIDDAIARIPAPKSLKDVFHAQDRRRSRSNGGTFLSRGQRGRTLNTVITNNITGASLASNKITLPAGTYYCEGSAPAYGVGSHRTRLYDFNSSTELVLGIPVGVSSSSGNNTLSHFSGLFTLSGTGLLEVQHFCQSSRSSIGFGFPQAPDASSEIFADIKIWKVSQ